MDEITALAHDERTARVVLATAAAIVTAYPDIRDLLNPGRAERGKPVGRDLAPSPTELSCRPGGTGFAL